MLTGNGLSEYARVHLGTPYFYGAKISEGVLTEKKMSTMHRMYPKGKAKGASRQGQCGLLWTDRRLSTA